ncbi:hypothetical protein [Massilia phyllosphaerae]|uniref:hypothetical protein n=1 Tax=Massilia phyllosphaerae TaxID=3106034 RepID=UPI002B1CE231|nr:hypothetical protein [Massilia sp. SGZ-792]
MKTFEEFNQLDVAVMTASCLIFGASVPREMPRWDGRNIDAFFAAKEEFSPTRVRYTDTTDDPWCFPPNLDHDRWHETADEACISSRTRRGVSAAFKRPKKVLTDEVRHSRHR